MVLNFHPELAPIKIAVLAAAEEKFAALSRPRINLRRFAQALACSLRRHGVHRPACTAGRMKSGTPFCVTVDVQTVGDDKAAGGREGDYPRPRLRCSNACAVSSLPAVMEKLMAGEWPDVFAITGSRKVSRRYLQLH